MSIVETNRIRETRIKKVNDLREKDLNPYPFFFNKTANAEFLQNKFIP